MGKLTDTFLRSAKPGKYEDGDGLRVVVTTKSKKWVFRFQIAGQRREMGFGLYPAVKVADARRAALEARGLIAAGRDPIADREDVRQKDRTIPTFGEIAAEVIATHEARGESKKSIDALKRYLGPTYVGPWLKRPVNEITSLDVLKLVTPLRKTKPEAARKFYPIIRKAFAKARIVLRDAHGISFENPAILDDMKAAGYVAPPRLSRGHHPSLPHQQLPEFLRELRALGTHHALAAELTILTVVRTGSLLEACAEEFDLEEGVWEVPIPHLKDRKHRAEPFRIPLCPRAIEIVKSRPRAGLLFPKILGGAYTEHLMIMALRQLGRERWVDPKQGNRPVNMHGFRATFRSWASDAREDSDLAEVAMGHVVGSLSERAYNRSDLFEHRRALMNRWCAHATGVPCDQAP
jgi:integrase